MNKSEITLRAITTGILAAVIAGIIVAFSEYAACYDYGISQDCIGNRGALVLWGIPIITFIVVFMATIRKYPDQQEYDLKLLSKLRKKDK